MYQNGQQKKKNGKRAQRGIDYNVEGGAASSRDFCTEDSSYSSVGFRVIMYKDAQETTIPTEYKIRYDANGGIGVPSEQTKIEGETLKLSTTKPTRTGYTFKGWAITRNATSATYQAGDSYIEDSDITLYAVWENNTYTVTLDANGGKFNDNTTKKNTTQTYMYEYEQFPSEPTRTGYKFTGWYTAVNGGDKIDTSMDVTIANDHTLYAHWEKTDTTAPTVTATPANTITYAKSYTINVTISEEVTDTNLYYYWHTSGTTAPTGTGAWPSVTINKSTNKATITVNGKTGTYYLWIGSLTDTAGNRKADNCVGSYKFDNTAPRITVSQASSNEWKREYPIKVTVTDTGAGINNIKENGFAYYYTTDNKSAPGSYYWTRIGEDGTYPCTLTSGAPTNATYYLWVNQVADDIGNDEGWRCVGGPYKLDTTAPTITSVTGNPTSWTKENVTLTVNGASDSASGLHASPYSFDGGATWQTGNTKTYNQNTNNIVIKVRDKLGNTYTNSAINITKIDKTAPTINSLTANPTSWTKGNVTITGKATDTESGISYYAFTTSNVTPSNWTSITNTKTQTTQTYTATTSGTYYLHVKDAAGNTKYSSVTVKIDKTAPTIRLGSQSSTTYSKAKTITVILADEGIGTIKNTSLQYGWSQNNTVAPSQWLSTNITNKQATINENRYTLTGKYYLWIKAGIEDGVGNITNQNTISTGQFWFDNTAPEVGINPDGETWVNERNYTQTKNITITMQDEHNEQINSNKLRYGWSKNKTDAPSEWKETSISNKQAVLNEVGRELTGEYYLWIDKGIQDGLGNSIQEYTQSEKPYYFDNTAPVLDLVATKGDGEITVEVKVAEEHSGLPTKTTFTYYIGTSPESYRKVETTDQTGYKFTGLNQGTNYYIKVEATDNAGNKGEKTITSTTKIKVTGVKLEPSLAEIRVGESIELEGKIIPENADNKKIIWTSSDNNIAVVDDNGRVVGKKEGTVQITITAEGGNTATSTVVVKARQINSGEISFSETMWKNNKASVTVTKQTESYEIQYQKNSQNGPWIPLKGDEITDLSHGDIIYARLSDGTYVGEVISKQIIDGEKPELNVTGNINDWQSESVTLEIQSYDMQSGLKQVTVNGEKVPLIGEIGKYEVKENGTYEIIAEDNAGNKTNKIEEIRYIDNKKPEIKVEKSTEEITKENIILNIQITENESGLKQVTINGKEIETTEGKVKYEIEENGTYKITAIDNCGNKQDKTITIDNIDKIPPEAIVKYETIQETGAVKATIIANERIKPVVGWKLSEDQTTLSKIYLSNKEEEIEIEDIAGNKNEKPIKIKIESIDNEELRIENIEYSTQEPTKDPVTVTITLNKEVQPVEGWELSENGMSLTKIYAENTTERIQIRDLSGQTVTTTIKINNIDKTAPEVEIKYSQTEYTNQDVTVTIKANEKIKEIEGWELSEDKTTLTKTFDKNYVDQIEIQDELGNKKAVEISIMNIDKQPPTEPKIEIIQGQKGENNWYIGDVIIKITGGEDLESGILKTTYEIKGTNNQEETIIKDGGMFRMTEEGTYQITAYSYDKALNKTQSKETVEIKIDTKAPEIKEIQKQTKTSSIKITTQAEDSTSGIQSYSYYVNGELKQTGENPTYEMTTLPQDTEYKIQIKVKDNAGWENVVEEQTIKTEKVPGGADKDQSTPEDPENPVTPIEPDEVIEPEQTKGRNIEVSSPEWENEKARVTVTTKTEYKIQYKIKGTEENWETIESGEKINNLLHNDIILLRLTDGTNEGAYMSVIILDKQKPEEFIQTIEEITTNGFRVKAQTQDNQSGLEKYQIWINGENKGENQEGTFNITGLKQNTEYEVQIIAIDKAGNQRIANNSEEMPDGKITTKGIPSAGGEGEENQDDPIEPEQTKGKNIEVTNPEWKDEKASVIVTTKTEYKIQYQINEKQEENWETVESGAKIEQLLHKDIIYLRLTDGVNVGAYIAVIILDKTAPTIESTKAQDIKAGEFTIKIEAKDEESGIATYEYYIDGQKQETSNKNTYTVKGLTQETTHTAYVIVTDKAGNKTSTQGENEIEITTQKMPGGGEVNPNSPNKPVDPENPSIELDPNDPENPVPPIKPDKPVEPETTIGRQIEVTEPEWEDGKASIEVKTETGYEIEYQVNGTEEGKWVKGDKIEGLENGDIVNIRLTDGNNKGEHISIIIKDEEASEKPEIKVISGTKEGTIYTSEVEIQITGGKDEQTGTEYTIYQIDEGEEIKITKDETIKITEEGKHKIKAYSVDKAGNKSEEETLEITIEKQQEDKYFRSKVYIITEEEILNISPKTTYKEFRNNIETNMEYKVETKEGDELGEEEYVGTGMKVKVEEKEYTLIVKGDTDGDGKVTIIDVARIQKHIIRNPKLEGESLKAGDTDLDGEVDLVDLARAMKSIVGLLKL